MSMLAELLAHIDERKAVLDQYRPLANATANSLRNAMALEWTYHSNAIEGNSLTLRETKVVLEGITVGGKTIRDHLEATNHARAITYLESLIADNGVAISHALIRELNQIVLSGIEPDAVIGTYRNHNVVITGASTVPVEHLCVGEAMSALIDWYQSDNECLHVIERVASFHARFEGIHPFTDGNGRTGRLLMNLSLMQAGYPPAIIRVDDRLAYYEALDKGCRDNDYMDIAYLIGQSIDRSLCFYLEVVTGVRPEPFNGSGELVNHP